jgi:outer membrane protein
MKKALSILTAVLSLSFLNLAYADNLKIGVINMNQIFEKSPLMVSINEQLTSKFKPRQDQLNTAKKDLQDEIDTLTLKGGSMNTTEQTRLQNKIITDRAAVDIMTANLQRDLTLAKNDALQGFTVKLANAISKVAKDGQYDLIEQTSNIPFVSNKLDITQQILQQLG